MPGIASLEAFERGVHEFDIANFQLDIEPAALDAARRSLDESGLLLLGEVHGVRQNALIARELMAALGITGLALEWPAGLAAAISGFFHNGQVPDHPLLWAGDGRITAGHFALLWERFAAGQLVALTLFDGVTEVGWSRREAAMAERILTAQGPAARTLVIAGNAHTALAPTGLGIPLGARLAERRSGVREVRIRYGTGGYYNLSPQRFKRQWNLRRRARLHLDGASLTLDLPNPVQARVPHRIHPNQPRRRPTTPGYTSSFPAYRGVRPLTGPQQQLGQPQPGQPQPGQPQPGQPQPGQPWPDQPWPGQPGEAPPAGQPQPGPAGQQRRHRPALPYEVELPTR